MLLKLLDIQGKFPKILLKIIFQNNWKIVYDVVVNN